MDGKNYMQNEDVLAQYWECDTCGLEMGEDGQEHHCSDCEEDLTETQCKEWNGLCEGCAYLIKR